MQEAKRKFPVLAVIAVILAVLAVGMLFLLLAPGPRMHWALTMGEKYLTQGNYEQAVTMFTRAIQVDDRAEAAYLGRAEAYTQLGDNEAAEADLTFIIDELGTGDAEVYLTRAAVYDALHQPEKAQADRDAAQKMGADVTEPDTTPEPTATPKPTKTVSLPTERTIYRDGKLLNTQIFQYDADNNISYFSDSLEGDSRHEFTFDRKGRVLTESTPYWSTEYQYNFDSNSNAISRSATSNNGVTTYEYYTYDDHGNVIQYVNNNDEIGGFADTFTYEYNDQNLITYKSARQGSDYICDEYTYTYEDDHYTVDERMYLQGDSHTVTTYSLDGIPMQRIEYSSDDSVQTCVTTYNADGNILTQDFYDETGAPTYTEVCSYDSCGRLTGATFTSFSTSVAVDSDFTCEYTFDTNGNVVSCTKRDASGTVLEKEKYSVATVSASYKLNKSNQDWDMWNLFGKASVIEQISIVPN